MHQKPHQRSVVRFAVAILLLLASAVFAGAALAETSVNKSIHVGDGETVERGLSSVNGGITVGERAELLRSAETVNGGITVDDGARTSDLSSVNGSVRVGEGVTVDGDLSTVNGTVRGGEQTVVTGNVETVNGRIELHGTTVHRDLRTINGRVILDRGSRVQGDLVVEDTKSRNWDSRKKPLEIELRDGSVIEGDVDVRDPDRKVIVRLSGGAAVMGQVRGAEVVQE